MGLQSQHRVRYHLRLPSRNRPRQDLCYRCPRGAARRRIFRQLLLVLSLSNHNCVCSFLEVRLVASEWFTFRELTMMHDCIAVNDGGSRLRAGLICTLLLFAGVLPSFADEKPAKDDVAQRVESLVKQLGS